MYEQLLTGRALPTRDEAWHAIRRGSLSFAPAQTTAAGVARKRVVAAPTARTITMLAPTDDDALLQDMIALIYRSMAPRPSSPAPYIIFGLVIEFAFIVCLFVSMSGDRPTARALLSEPMLMVCSIRLCKK